MEKDNKLQFNPQVQVTKVDYVGLILDNDKNLFDWNKGSSIFDAHPFFEILRVYTSFKDVDEAEQNYPCIHIDGKICDISLLYKKDEITIILYDYTAKYKDLNQIAQQKNESVLLARALELKNQYLLEKEKFKNSFISNINHEIRTPLTGILGFIEVLEKTQLNFEQEELTRIIKRESLHLNALIDDMIDISKIESGQVHIVEERFSFESLIQGFVETYSKKAENTGVEFKTEINPNISEYLIGDRKRVYQILNNLLNNAYKYTEEGSVTLSVDKNFQRTNKTSLTFKIEDTGVGIHEDDLPNVFDRFTRFNQDKQIAGTGLGLAIAKNLIDLLDGEIKVESKIDKGTTFTLKLPFKIEVLKTQSAAEKKKKKYTLPSNKKKFRILVIENEEVTQYLIMKILIDTGNFFVDMAMTGEQALKYIERRTYDVILMDLHLDDKLDGFKVTHKIRNNYGDDFISQVPIIGISGKFDEATRDKCIRGGMDDFIPKPFEQEELLYKITKHIAKKATV